MDWFQPFKRRNDRPVGVIYLVLLNLPQEQRFKWENLIVAGVVPEMKKEPKSLNTFVTSHGKTYTNAFPLNGLKRWQSVGYALGTRWVPVGSVAWENPLKNYVQSR